MDRGYIKLWRKSLDSPLWKNHNAWRVWEWCLMKATHCERIVVVGKQEVLLQPGQFIFGRQKAVDETGLSEQKIRTAFKILTSKVTNKVGISTSNLTTKPTNKYSIISIVKWEDYQTEVTNNLTSKVTNKVGISTSNLTTNKKNKNNKNSNKKERYKERKEDFILPDFINPETWEAFIEMRKKNKAAPTEHAKYLLVQQLEKLKADGNNPDDVLNQSIMNNWKGLFAVKEDMRTKTKEKELD